MRLLNETQIQIKTKNISTIRRTGQTRLFNAAKKKIGKQAIGNRTGHILHAFTNDWPTKLIKNDVRRYLKKTFFLPLFIKNLLWYLTNRVFSWYLLWLDLTLFDMFISFDWFYLPMIGLQGHKDFCNVTFIEMINHSKWVRIKDLNWIEKQGGKLVVIRNVSSELMLSVWCGLIAMLNVPLLLKRLS